MVGGTFAAGGGRINAIVQTRAENNRTAATIPTADAMASADSGQLLTQRLLQAPSRAPVELHDCHACLGQIGRAFTRRATTASTTQTVCKLHFHDTISYNCAGMSGNHMQNALLNVRTDYTICVLLAPVADTGAH